MFGNTSSGADERDPLFSPIRYTSSNDGQSVYACLLIWPQNTTEVLLGAPAGSASTSVKLLGSNQGFLTWSRASTIGGMIIDVSNIEVHSLKSDWTWVFKLQNISARKEGYTKSKWYN